jgi:cyanophycinase
MLKLILALLLLLPTMPSASSTQPKKGTLLIAGGAASASIHSEFIKLAGENARVAVITTAAPSNSEQNIKYWEGLCKGSVVGVCNDEPFPEDVTAIWVSGGDQGLLEKCYIGKSFEQKLIDFYNRGGIIGGTSAGAAFMSKIMIRGGTAEDLEMGTGLDLLPHCIIDQHFTARNRLPRLEKAVAYHPGIYGFGIDENTAMLYNSGVLRVLGENQVTVLHCGTIKKLRSGEELVYEHP